MRGRENVRIGIPRVLNLYSLAPFFTTFFESLGVAGENIVFSDYTSLELYKAGCKRGSIDPCWPSKVCIAHVHNLLYKKHTAQRPLDYIWFPMIDAMPTWLEHTVDNRACPTAAITPESVKAAFIKEGDIFEQVGVKYLDPMLHMDEPALLVRQLYSAWGEVLGLSQGETRRAVQAGYAALEAFQARLQEEGRQILEQIEREDRVGLVVLSRPYHADPGISHGIVEELQKLGYPILTQDTLPLDGEVLERLFGEEVASEACASALSIDDVWKNSYSENTNRKIWAAKFVAQASEPGGAGAEQLQVRARCADLHADRGDRGDQRHALLLLQGHRREQADGLDQDPHRDDRVLPEAVQRAAWPSGGGRRGRSRSGCGGSRSNWLGRRDGMSGESAVAG